MIHLFTRSKTAILGGLSGLIFLSLPAIAQEKSADDLARELANPNSPLASLNFKNQFRFFDGSLPNAGDQSSYTMLFQPGFPFALENGDQVIWRPAIPFIIDQPIYNPATRDFGSESGMGDIGFDLAYSRTTDSGLLTAFGIFTTLPTASSSLLGSGQWSIGPEILIGKITEKYVIGAFPNHQWDIAGWGDGSVNLTTMQVFATYLPGGGWNVGTSPICSYDWHRDQWTIPLNLTVGKTVVLGGKPWKFSAEINYYVEKPSNFGAEWMVGFNITPVVENVLASWFK
ncbi:MAG: hypothetical protein N2A42_06660 [Luteolibacter sp.]